MSYRDILNWYRSYDTVMERMTMVVHGMHDEEAVTLSMSQRGTIVEILREHLAGVRKGEIVYGGQDAQDEMADELETIIEIVNTPTS